MRRVFTTSYPPLTLIAWRAVHVPPSKPGSSDEDALGAEDPLQAVGDALRGCASHPPPHNAALPPDVDPIASAVNRRRNRRKRTVDSIFGDVLHDALRLRDLGHKPDADFVYKRTQERMYEAEYGHKPPSATEHATKYTPFPPDFRLHRLLPFASVAGEDPWPARAVTAANPVWTRQSLEADRQATGGAAWRAWERRMFAPREGFDPIGEFTDAMEELAYWEERFVRFLRAVPLPQRRTLPYLHEHYRYLTHRLIRAERRFIGTRDAAVAKARASTSVFKMTEDKVDRVRALYAETHKSLSSPNYDPTRMKKSVIGPLMVMTETEFDEWRNVERHRRNRLAAELL